MWEEESKKSGKKKWIIIILVVFLVCCFLGVVCVSVGFIASGGDLFGTLFGNDDCDPPEGILDLSAKTVVTDSLYAKEGNYASKNAVDLDRVTFTHNDAETKLTTPWLRVELVDQYIISKVEYFGRPDCCWERDNDVQVRVGNYKEEGDQLFVLNALCAEIFGGGYGKGQKLSFTCGDWLVGQYLTLQKTKTCEGCKSNVLSVGEIHAWGSIYK